eukprot:TRINITY_DN7180_c0_g1_i7.p1 TRINITY_DN7180_c0_g1~~TRINITY_DN7180_c0_g1_i7.p1  ORF type:complete len:1040 (+),score=264.44 TRINITY_DN7180_c0_g1_i7:141-3260(+)
MENAESPGDWSRDRDRDRDRERDRDRDRDEDDWDIAERRRHRSSKSRKSASERSSGKRKSSSSGKAPGSGDDEDFDDLKGDDYMNRGRNTDIRRSDRKSSSSYQDTAMVSARKGREDEDRSRRQGGILAASDYDKNQSKRGSTRVSKGELGIKASGKDDNDPDNGSVAEEGKYSGRRGSGMKIERRWEDADLLRSSHNEGLDLEVEKGEKRLARVRDNDLETRNESEDFNFRGCRSRAGEGFQDESKSSRLSSRDIERRMKGKGRSELHAGEEDSNRAVNVSRSDSLKDEKKHRSREGFDNPADDINTWEKCGGQRQSYKTQEEKHERYRSNREHGYNTWDDAQSSDVQGNEDDRTERGRIRERRDVGWEEEDAGRCSGRGEEGVRSGGSRGRNGRGVRSRKRSWSPERKRPRRDSEDFDKDYSEDRGDSDTERSISLKGRDRDREVYRTEDRFREKDSEWIERGRDWEGSKDHWKNRHHDRHEKDMKNEEADYEFDRDWELHGRERDRTDRDKFQRSGDRKDKGRMDMRTMSGFGPSGDYGRGDSAAAFMSNRRNDSGGTPPDFDGNWGYNSDERGRMAEAYLIGSDFHERCDDDASQGIDQSYGTSSGRGFDGSELNIYGGRGRGHKGSMNNRNRGGGQAGNGAQSPFGNNNQSSGSFTRGVQQGGKGGRGGRGGRGRVLGRDAQRGGIPLPMMGAGPAPGVPGMGPPFGPLGLPPGAMQSMGPGMGPSPGPPMGPGGIFPHYPAPLVWGAAGRGGGDMNMLPVPPGMSPVPPPGHSGPRFPPNMGPGPNQGMYFNQPGPARVVSPAMPGAGYGPGNTIGRGMLNDKPGAGRGLPRVNGPPGKAPSRGEQNDYSQNFVDTGMRPQNFIRELELTNVVEDYPKLRELIQKKDEIVAKSASPPMYLKCDLRETVLSSELFGTKFDVILVDPPWEEYVHRAPGVGDHMEYWTFEEIQNLKIEAIAENPSFIFLWVGDGMGLEQGRACLKKWGFRRCEDICWVKTNKANPSPGLRHDSHTLFQHSKVSSSDHISPEFYICN